MSRFKCGLWPALCAFFLLAAPACDAVDDSDETELEGQTEALCSSVSLSSNANGPVTPGTNVSLTASSTCGMGETAEYQFAMRRDGTNTTTVVRAWAASNTATWNTTGLTSGKWSLIVSARPMGTTTAQHFAITLYVGNVCINPTLSPSPTSAGPGTTVTLTASSTCSSGTPEYRFLVRAAGSATYTEARTWGAATYGWNTTGLATGSYGLKVESRAVGNSALDGSATAAFTLRVACGADLAVSASPLGAAVGVPVTVTGAATCNSVGVTPEVRYSYRPNSSSTYTVFRDWGTSPATWDTAGLATGSYTLRAEARAPGGTATTMKTMSYTLGGSCSVLNMTVSPGSPRDVGTVLTLTGAATCSAGVTPQYRFMMRTPLSTSDVQLRDWSSSASFMWNTEGAVGGRYELFVQARANSSSLSALARSTIFRLGKMCTSVTASMFPGSTQAAGAPLTANATASCYFGGSAVYRFSSRLVGGNTWNVIRDWNTAANAAIDTNAAAGSYELLVEVKGAGMVGEAQGSRTLPFTLTAACGDGYENGVETDVDCGGSCGGCAVGEGCITNSDCSSQVCSEGVCAEVSCDASLLMGVWTGYGPQRVAINPQTHKAYVVANGSDSVAVVDDLTGARTIVPVGSNPIGIAVNTLTNKIYVANSGYSGVGYLSVIDGNTNQVSGHAFGGYPYMVEVNEETDTIYATMPSLQQLAVLNGATGGVAMVTLTAASPNYLAVNPVTNRIYVGHSGGQVSVVDGATNTVLALLATAGPVQDIGVNTQTNKVYVANYASPGWISELDGATNVVTQIRVGNWPGNLTIDENRNRVLVGHYGDYALRVIDGATRQVTVIPVDGEITDTVVDPSSGAIYVGQYLWRVQVFTSSLQLDYTVNLDAGGTQFLGLDTGNGRVVASVGGNPQVYVLGCQ